MKTARTLLFLSLALWLPAGCGKHAPATDPAGPAVCAPVETVKAAPVNETYEAVGTVQAQTTSLLATRVAGNVLSVAVQPGDRVEAGQVLLQISDADIVALVAKAKAGLAEAENALQETDWAIKAGESAKAAAEAARALATANYQRARTLLQNKSVSQLEFDESEAKYKTALAEADRAAQMHEGALSRRKQAQAKVEQARAEIVNAETQLTYTRIVSPVAGLVTAKSVDVGSFVSPGAPLMRVEDNRRYRVETGVEESLVARIGMGDEVAVQIDALAGAPLAGRVSEIVPASDPGNRTFRVKLDLPANPALRSGLFARATFVIGRRLGLTVPPAALLERGQLTAVYVLDARDLAHLRLVKTGRRQGERVEILSGLNDHERVVADGVAQVREGVRVAPAQGDRP